MASSGIETLQVCLPAFRRRSSITIFRPQDHSIAYEIVTALELITIVHAWVNRYSSPSIRGEGPERFSPLVGINHNTVAKAAWTIERDPFRRADIANKGHAVSW